MKTIPNRKALLAQQSANLPKSNDELYESIHDAIVDALEGGAVNAGQVLFDSFAFAVNSALENRLRHAFYAEGYDLYFVVTRNGYRRTLIYLEKAPHATI